MANLSSPRNTVTVGPQLYGTSQPLDQDGYVVEGCLVGSHDGYANDISLADGYCLGIANRSAANDADGNAAGDASCVALSGRFMLDGTLGQADVGKDVYASDNHTVALSGTVKVGRLVAIDLDSGQLVVEVIG